MNLVKGGIRQKGAVRVQNPRQAPRPWCGSHGGAASLGSARVGLVRLSSSQDIHGPALVGFPLVTRAEDHLVPVVLMTT